MELFIDETIKTGKTLIVEGSHLDAYFNAKMIAKYKRECLCYVITVNEPK